MPLKMSKAVLNNTNEETQVLCWRPEIVNQPLKRIFILINKTFKFYKFKKNIYSINNLRVSSWDKIFH